MKKFFASVFALLSMFAMGVGYAAEYHYFYSETCGHCIQVAKYFEQEQIEEQYSLHKYEIHQDPMAMEQLMRFLEKLELSITSIGTPFMVIEEEDGTLSSLLSSKPIIQYFTALKGQETGGDQSDVLASTSEVRKKSEGLNFEDMHRPSKFLAIMIPMAIADSINPCAFAVMLLLLSTILTKSKSRKKTILAGVLFAFAIFLSYFLLGIGVFEVLATAQMTVWFKWIVGGLGLLLGIANIKDYFWYGKGMLMEVPLAWRPKMMKLIQGLLSPRGAFGIGVLVSLFLLPCSSGPYVAILLMLKSENVGISSLGVSYLLLYNFLFILPMLIITFLVGGKHTSIEKIAKFKNKNTKLMHLIMGILMFLLGGYVIASIYLPI